MIGIVSIFFAQLDLFNQGIYGTDQNENGYYYYHYVKTNNYYYQANDLIKDELRQQLHLIINDNLNRVSYKEVRAYLELSDLSLSNKNMLYMIYDSQRVNVVKGGSLWEVEHVWPNSKLGVEEIKRDQKNIASDLHNLRAITALTQDDRSNYFYSKGSGTNHLTDDGGFYPGDDHKGDVARILLYMSVMYDELILTDDLECLLDDSTAFTPEGAKMGLMALLVKWHKEDPVDRFEKDRNEIIFGIQGNRNPFIDMPEYVHLIWENKEINELSNLTETLALNNIDITLKMDQENDKNLRYFIK